MSKLKRLFQMFKTSMGSEDQDYTKLPIKKAIFLLSLPMIFEMMMESVFAVVDLFFVGKLGDEALATVGLTESVLMIIYSVGMGISMAATAMISRRFGEKKLKEAGTAAFQLIFTGGILALVISITTFAFSKDILRMMGATENLINFGSGYTKIIFASNIVIVLLFLINGIFRGAGNPQLAMRTLILANGLNIILDPILIFGFGYFEGYGIEGAAIATTIGRGIGVLYQLYHLFFKGNKLQILKENIQIQFSTIVKILGISAGGMGQFLIDSASWILLTRILAEYGGAVLAGYTIAFRVILFTILPSWGLSGAAATLVGQNLGANNPERAESAVWITAKYNVIFLGFITILFLVFGQQIASIFSNQKETIGIANSALSIITLGYVFFGLGMVMTQAFNGAGDTRTPMIINICVLWLVEIPLAYFLSNVLSYGPTGVFIAVALCHSLQALVCWWWFRKGRWKKVKI
jgi:putative MATE family efflux protein